MVGCNLPVFGCCLLLPDPLLFKLGSFNHLNVISSLFNVMQPLLPRVLNKVVSRLVIKFLKFVACNLESIFTVGCSVVTFSCFLIKVKLHGLA